MQTDLNGKCTAKNLNFSGKFFPTMELKNATKGLFKDVWIYELEDDSRGTHVLNSFCMSSDDDSLHTSAVELDCEANESEMKNLTQNFGKIKS